MHRWLACRKPRTGLATAVGAGCGVVVGGVDGAVIGGAVGLFLGESVESTIRVFRT